MASQSNEVDVCSCESCGQKIRKLNPHRMCKKSVALLELLAKEEGAWVRMYAGTGATTPEGSIRAPYRAQAYALYGSWFGLIEHGGHRSGLYRITDLGLLFLRGLASIPAVIWCKGGKVIEKSDARVCVEDIRGVVLDKDYWDNYAAIQRAGYANPTQSSLGI